MTKKEYEVLDRWADRYDVIYTPTESKVSFWDFTYVRTHPKKNQKRKRLTRFILQFL